MNFSPRIWFLIGLLSCLIMLGLGSFFQFVKELQPCPLCISQRIFILLTGIGFLIAAIFNPKHIGLLICSISTALLALCGAAISSRHVWLQNLPPEQIPECGPGLEYIFENFPLSETIKLMLNGTGECADVLWTFLGVSIPGWTLVGFLLLAGISLLQIWNVPPE